MINKITSNNIVIFREERQSNRHIILIASMNPYEDIPIIESNNYRDLKFDEVLQSLSKVVLFEFFRIVSVQISIMRFLEIASNKSVHYFTQILNRNDTFIRENQSCKRRVQT